VTVLGVRVERVIGGAVIALLAAAISCATRKDDSAASVITDDDAGIDAPPFAGDFGRGPDAGTVMYPQDCTLARAGFARGSWQTGSLNSIPVSVDCSFMGSPSTEHQRDPASEPLTPHYRFSDFFIDRTEVTRAQWKMAGFVVPDEAGAAPSSGCTDDTCPIDNVTWQEAIAFANARAKKPCFDLSACTGVVGRDFSCSSIPLTTGTNVYECDDYRLPTAYEFEIAARGSSLTWTITPPPPTPSAGCWDLASLDSVAWYCSNADGGLHPVASLDAGLIGGEKIWDMIGNAAELVFDAPHPNGYAAELSDPGGITSPTAWTRYVKGGSFDAPAAHLRPASLQRTQAWNVRVPGVSFRLARTMLRSTPSP